MSLAAEITTDKSKMAFKKFAAMPYKACKAI